MHVGVFLVIIYGLPSFVSHNIVDQPAITVEILSISEITNIAPRKVKPKPKPPETKEVTTAQAPKLSMPDPTIEPELIEAKPTLKPESTKEPEIKEKEIEELAPEVNITPVFKPRVAKKDEEMKKEIAENLFDSVLKSVEELNVEEEVEQKEPEQDFGDVTEFLSNIKEEDSKYKPGLPLSFTEKDAIRQQVMRNWTILGGAKDAQEMIVTLTIKLAPDGSVKDVKIMDKIRYNTDAVFRAMADSAVRAVFKTSPLKNLPENKYDVKDGWREFELVFNPSEMIY